MLFHKFKEQQHKQKAERESEARRRFVEQLEASDKLAQYMQATPAPQPLAPNDASRAESAQPKPAATVHASRTTRTARLDLSFVGPSSKHTVRAVAPKPAAKPEQVATRQMAPFAQAVHNVEQEVEQVVTELKEAVEETLSMAPTAVDRSSLLLPNRRTPARVAVPERSSSDVYSRPILARSAAL